MVRRWRLVWGIGVLAGCCAGAWAQSSDLANNFAPYTACSLPGGPSVAESTPLAAGITSRTVKTILGSYDVPLIDGKRIMFAYPGESFYANEKVELLPEKGYAEAKAALVKNFEYILASGDNVRNYQLKPKLNGFEIQGLDKTKREGGVLGIYLLFDDPTRTVITFYMLNQEPPERFKSMQEYAILRDVFLKDYTACVRNELGKHQ